MIYAVFNQFKNEYIAFFSTKQKAISYIDNLNNRGMDGYSLVFIDDYKILEIKLDQEV